MIPESAASAQGPDPHEPLYSAAAVAQDWFARQLRESAEAEGAREYLVDRGHPDSRSRASWGSATRPRRRGVPWPPCAELGVKEEDLLEAGLVVRRDDGRIGPRFREPAALPDPRPARAAWWASAGGSSGRASRSTSTRPRRRSSTRAGSSTTCTSRRTAIRRGGAR